MRIIHTADWHLGRVFHGVHLTEDQAYLLDQFLDLVKEAKADVILISGDVYDRSVPPTEAVNLLDDFLSRVSLDYRVPIIAISGNHDSPDRLGFGNRLLRHQGIHVIGRLTHTIDPIVVEDDYGPVYFCALPFAEPALVRERLGEDQVVDHDTAMNCLIARALSAVPQGVRTVALAHAFVAGCEESDSERPISVGGTGTVSATCFKPFNYVALGHLHRPQSAGAENIRYAGSLMKYSFSEASHKKSINIVEMNGKGKVSVETVSLTPRRDVRCLEGFLEDILKGPKDGESKDDYLMVTLNDEGALLDPMGKLREVYSNVLHIERPFVSGTRELTGPGKDYKNQTTLDLFTDFYEQISNTKLTEEQAQVFAEIVEKLEQEEREGGV